MIVIEVRWQQRFLSEISSPSTRIFPSTVSKNRKSERTNEVFPAPVRPTTPTFCPGFMSMLSRKIFTNCNLTLQVRRGPSKTKSSTVVVVVIHCYYNYWNGLSSILWDKTGFWPIKSQKTEYGATQNRRVSINHMVIDFWSANIFYLTKMTPA